MLPHSLERPRLAPPTTWGNHAVDEMSSVTLLAWSSTALPHVNLSWQLDLQAGSASATSVAYVDGSANGVLVFAGPLADALSNCSSNGRDVTPASGQPMLPIILPRVVAFDWEARSPKTFKYIKLSSATHGSSAWCETRGTTTDDPPLHAFYIPDLFAYVQQQSTGSQEDTPPHSACVTVARSAITDFEEACDTSATGAVRSGSFSTTILPEEQGLRDSRLLLLGALCGAAAAALFEAVILLLAGARPRRIAHKAHT